MLGIMYKREQSLKRQNNMDQPVQPMPPQQPMQPSVNPSKTGLIVGIIAGVMILVLVGVIFYMYNQSNKTQDNAELMRESGDQLRQSADYMRQGADEMRNAASGSNAPVSSSSTPATNASPAPSRQSGSSTSSTPPTPSAPSAANFAGEWNGTYTSNPLAGKTCEASGAASFSVKSDGSVTGYAMISSAKVPGTGKVDKNGNLTGTWNYAGGALSYSGKLNTSTNTGSGSYRNSFGCFGSFSIKR